MSNRPRVVLILAAVLLVAAGAITAAQKVKPPVFGTPTEKAGKTTAPVVLSGENLGFRVDGYRDGVPVGAFVVQVNGKWVEPQDAPKVRPAR